MKKFPYLDTEKDFFPSVGLKLTGACRLNCPFCCEPERTVNPHPLDNYKLITEKLHTYGTERLCYTGGDPLLYDGIGELLAITKGLGFRNLLLTSDGDLLRMQNRSMLNHIDAVRFSIHNLGETHDEIVNYKGAFQNTKAMIDELNALCFKYYIATVVTNSNLPAIKDIAKWSFENNASGYYLFGLMKSGRGRQFIDKYGDADAVEVDMIYKNLEDEYKNTGMKISYYPYSKKAECVLVYGDGSVVIDPYPIAPLYQLPIGNILNDSMKNILMKFFEDEENYDSYIQHLSMYKE